MKPTLNTLLLFFFFSLVSPKGLSQEQTTLWSARTAQSFMKRYPNPDSIHWVGESNHFSWQAGYIMFAMEKLWKATGDSSYFNYIKRYVDQQVDDRGNIPDFRNTALDNFLPGYAILFMYEQTHLDKYRIAATKIRAGFDSYPRTSNGLFWHANWAKQQVWVDGVFMGQIFLARYGKVVGDSKYAFDEVVKQITLIAGKCQKANGLLLHGWDESKRATWADKATGLAPEVWSEGLGWYAVLLADVLDYLPKNHPGYPKICRISQDLCVGLKNTQDPQTGLWCQVVDKCNEPGNWNETSGTGMFLYLLKKSVDTGVIPASEYLPVIQSAYAGIIRKARPNANGFMDLYDCSSIGIQKNYQAYISQPREVSPFAAFGSFLIGTSAVEMEK
jgi:Predicted unsaturated glucuronyl hydrolase involved in regulation of bacterial surface properties, and related proteins